VVKVMNKQRMVVMNEIDIANLFELDMEKLKIDKVVNPHCPFFTLIATVGSHKIFDVIKLHHHLSPV
jgi:hypothetical protein